MDDKWKLSSSAAGRVENPGERCQSPPTLLTQAGRFSSSVPPGRQAGAEMSIPGLSVPAPAQFVPPDGESGLGQWWEQMSQGQEQFLQQVLGGLGQMEDGFGGMFAKVLTTGNDTFDRLGLSLAKMGQGMLGGLTKSGGPLSFLGSAFSSVQSALGFLSPATSILSTGFKLFKGIKGLFGGKKTRQLASPLVNRSDYKPQAASAPAQQSGRTVNVYINGQSLGSAVEVDRTLGRAGVDRRLRSQVKELVRSGANPVVS